MKRRATRWPKTCGLTVAAKSRGPTSTTATTVPCPTYGDDCHWQAASAVRAEREALLEADDAEWDGFAAGFAYWVRPCDSVECVEELAARTAREFAEESSALHQLAMTGAVVAGAAEEADECRQAATAADQSDLETLCQYIAAVGERPPVQGWLIR